MAIATVALSVAIMVTTSAFIAGFKKEISHKIFEFWGHIHISDTGYSLSFDPKPISIIQDFYPSLDTIRKINYTRPSTHLQHIVYRNAQTTTHAGISHIQAFAHKPGIIRTKNAMEGILLKGIGPDFDWSHLKPYLLAGSPLSPQPDSTPTRDILISRQTADRLKIEVGQKIIVHFIQNAQQLRRLFIVRGIYKTGLEEYDRKFAFCDIRMVQELLGWEKNEVAGFEIWLDDLRDLEPINTYIYEELLPTNLLSITIKEKFPAIFEWLQLQDYNEIVLLSLMLAVAIINMITALLILVLERTQMIGILKALGAPNFKIRQIFLYHAAGILLHGMAWGNLLGIGFCLLQDTCHLITLNEEYYYLAYAPVDLNTWNIVLINLGTTAITLLFLLIPSYAVSRVSPVKAIRFK
jgi:lipoprotein-releasing system permease protein